MSSTSPKGLLISLRQKSHWATFLLLMAITPMLTSCYGHFPMTRLIYRVNGEVGGSIGNDTTQRRFLQSIVMWVFIIVPVYGVSMFADVIVLNVIEFWTGNPVELGEHMAPDGTRFALVPAMDGRTATLTVSKNGKVLQREQLIKVSDTLLEVRHENGTLAGTAERTSTGDMIFKDASGKTVSTVPASQVPARSML